jgi:regulatory protein
MHTDPNQDNPESAAEPSSLFDSPTPTQRRKCPEPTPAQRALGLLVRREHSRKELARKLAARGVESDEAAATVERMAGEGWQDDARFAEFLLRSRAANGYGPQHVRAELGSHGLERETIATAMENFEGDWVQVARDLIRRRFGDAGPRDAVKRRKAEQLLVRRGFSGDILRAVLGKIGDSFD